MKPWREALRMWRAYYTWARMLGHGVPEAAKIGVAVARETLRPRPSV